MLSASHSFFASLVLFSVCAAAQDLNSAVKPVSESPISGSELYLKVRLDSPFKVSKLKHGDQVSGRLLHGVYSGDTEVFPALMEVRLSVDRLDRRRRVPNDHWPWMIRAFTPRHEQYPVFSSASVTNPDGHETSLQVSSVFVSKEVDVEPKTTKKTTPALSRDVSQKSRRELGPIVTLVASTISNADAKTTGALPVEPRTVAAGTEAKVILLRDVSSSKNHAGDSFQARLIEPVQMDAKTVLPEGSVFEGKVLKSRASRTLSRSGSIYFTFTNLTVPGGASSAISATVAGAEVSQRSHTVIDPEGRMHGDRPGKVWMLLNGGVTAGISKEVDDGTQLIIEAIVSTATDASTAGTARIASTCVSTIFVLTRHGRDVVLPKYTQLRIIFDRPAEILAQPVSPAPDR